jgi:mycofactocin precursor
MAETILPSDEIVLEEQTTITIIENSAIEAPADAEELDLALEDELIIEDFTIDGICGVY